MIDVAVDESEEVTGRGEKERETSVNSSGARRAWWVNAAFVCCLNLEASQVGFGSEMSRGRS